METNMTEPNAFQDLFQMIIYRYAGQMLSHLIRENQVLIVLDSIPCSQLPYLLYFSSRGHRSPSSVRPMVASHLLGYS